MPFRDMIANDPFHLAAVADLETRVLIAYNLHFPTLHPQPVGLNAGERHVLGLLIDRYGDNAGPIIDTLWEHWTEFARKVANYATDGNRPHIARLA